MPTAIRSQHFVLERLLKKVIRERWPETFGRAHAPIDTGSEQINRLSQGRLRTPCATRGGPLRASPELGHRTGAAQSPASRRLSQTILVAPAGLQWPGSEMSGRR